MSTKDWKNGELTTLLSEAWGFGFKVDRLTEAGDPTGIESDSEEGEEKAKKSLKGDDKGKEGMEALDEDSGEEEKRHYEDNAWNDEDHIEAIEKHLRALKHDKDYDEDHEALEENTKKLNEMTGLEPLVGGLVAAGLDSALAASIGQLAVSGGLGGAILGLLSGHEPGLSPEAQAVASGADEEELEERRARGRASARNQRGPADPRQRTENLARVQEIVNRVVKQLKEKQKNG